MFPHIRGRILTLVRCPGGQHEGCFYQKHVHSELGAFLDAVRVREKHGTAEYFEVRRAEGLLSLVQMGVLEIHGWNARSDRPDRPDQLVFDLDPGPNVRWGEVVEAAREARSTLSGLGLDAFVKTTGSKGLHVIVPLVRRTAWSTGKAFSKAVAQRLCQRNPDRYVCNTNKNQRAGRIFVDYLRNDRGATSICPYSTRALPAAPVAAPISWDELGSLSGADSHTVYDAEQRLSSGPDPWAGYFETKQSITRRMLEALDIDDH
jgi:bifunctional non-homologous end joining protein LigD